MKDGVCNGFPGLCHVMVSESHFVGTHAAAGEVDASVNPMTNLLTQGYRAFTWELFYKNPEPTKKMEELRKDDLYVAGLGREFTLREASKQLKVFLDENSNEVVILKVSHQKHFSLRNIREIFQETGLWDNVYLSNGTDVSLGKLVESKTPVIVLFDHYQTSPESQYKFLESSFFWDDAFSRNYLADNYHPGGGFLGLFTNQSHLVLDCTNTRGNAEQAWLTSLQFHRGEQTPWAIDVEHLNAASTVNSMIERNCQIDHAINNPNIIFADYTAGLEDSRALFNWEEKANQHAIASRNGTSGRQYFILFGVLQYLGMRLLGLSSQTENVKKVKPKS